MKPFPVSEVRKIVGGTLIKGCDDLLIKNAAWYPDRIKKQNTLLFQRNVSNRELDIINKYTPCAIITNNISENLNSIKDCTVIKVDNVLDSYWKFVEYYRNLFQIPVIAVTGTTGKSTTKDMIKHILKFSCNVEGTNASANASKLNLDYLLKICEETGAAVIETAVGAPGNIILAGRYFKPTIGIITNIGIDHLDRCKTLEAYTKAKAEMLTVLGDNGTLIINSDDENTKKIELEKFKGRIITFGINNISDFQASNVQFVENGMEFVLTFHLMKHRVFVPGYGVHQVYNALAAFAAVHELGIGIKEAAEHLQSFKNLPKHLQSVQGIGGSLILDDTWSINPTSLKAALQTLNAIAKGRKKIALLGPINALGEKTMKIASLEGSIIAESGVDILVIVGETSEAIARQAKKDGLAGQIKVFPSTDGVLEFLKTVLDSNTILLAKCSMYDQPFRDWMKNLRV